MSTRALDPDAFVEEVRLGERLDLSIRRREGELARLSDLTRREDRIARCIEDRPTPPVGEYLEEMLYLLAVANAFNPRSVIGGA